MEGGEKKGYHEEGRERMTGSREPRTILPFDYF